jgi:hypothetical protein
VNRASLRVFGVFFVGAPFVSFLMLCLTQRWFWLVERLGFPYEPSPVHWFEAFLLTLVWIVPAQAFVTVLATLYYSFFKRIPLWFVLSAMIPLCALIVTYKDISDCCDRIERGDIRKLLYWTLVITPAELMCARYVSRKIASLPGYAGTDIGDKS